MLNPLNFFKKIIKSSNQKELDRLSNVISKINVLEESFQKLKDSEFPIKTKEFKEHEFTPWALKHRREEECCVSYWFDKSDKSFHPVNYIEEENDDCTKLDRNFVIDLICAIDERDKKSLLK